MKTLIRPHTLAFKIGCLAGLLMLLVGCPGCWDQIEIQQRAFVLGIGIDYLAPDELEPVQIREPGITKPQTPQLLLTMEIPKLNQLGGGGSNGGGGGGGGGQEKPAWVPSVTGVNISQAIAKLGVRANRHPSLGHLRVIVVGEEFAKTEGLRKILDFFFRDPEVQRQVPIFIAHGKAREVLAIKPPDDQLASQYFENMNILEKLYGRFYYISIGDIASELHQNGNAIMGRIRPEKEEGVSGGAAVIKNWKLAGFLGEIETLGARLILGRLNRAAITVNFSDGSWLGLILYGAKKEVKPIWNGKQLKLKITIQTEGEIAQMPEDQTVSNLKTLKKQQKSTEEFFKTAIQATLHKMQKEYKTDVLKLGLTIRRHWPKIWKEIGPRWNREFQEIQISVKVEHKFRRAGVML